MDTLSFMKKIHLLAVGVALSFSSCYCNKITIGSVGKDEELVHVASERNVHLLGGAIVTHKKAKRYVPDVENYVIATKHTFGDLFAHWITCGIYTPTTTKYYVPKSDPRVVVKRKKFGSKAYKGYLTDKGYIKEYPLSQASKIERKMLNEVTVDGIKCVVFNSFYSNAAIKTEKLLSRQQILKVIRSLNLLDKDLQFFLSDSMKPYFGYTNKGYLIDYSTNEFIKIDEYFLIPSRM